MVSPVYTVAQAGIRTILPQKPVIAGEPFQVQFILEDNEDAKNFIPPDFNGFRVISGPNIYKGREIGKFGRSIVNKNITFTLVPPAAGIFIIGPAKMSKGHAAISSGQVTVKVISRREANYLSQKERDFFSKFSDYRLLPGEDPFQKIKQNLFLKLSVDKKNCFVGEPVTATFKLYSRLESKSDIVKNPGFYGFTVYDMINLADRFVVTEKIGGKDFDVHTIRKVQLFPLQAGSFTVDPMEIVNKVEFTRSAVYKKTEQEIAEGILGSDKFSPENKNTEVFETAIHTEPVTILVRPLPVSKLSAFNGAVGNFSIMAVLPGTKFARDEQGYLNIVIKGAGNFLQINAPKITWPDGVEGFDPLIIDSLNKLTSPTTGSRAFQFPFASSKPGEYFLPALDFSFFNPDSGKYKTISTREQRIVINNTIYKDAKSVNVKADKSSEGILHSSRGILYLFAGLLLLTSTILLFSKKGKRKVSGTEDVLKTVVSVEKFLLPAAINLHVEDKSFYLSLSRAIWNYLSATYILTGSEMSKQIFIEKMKSSGTANDSINELIGILDKCETGIYADAVLTEDKTKLLERTGDILKTLPPDFFRQT